MDVRFAFGKKTVGAYGSVLLVGALLALAFTLACALALPDAAHADAATNPFTVTKESGSAIEGVDYEISDDALVVITTDPLTIATGSVSTSATWGIVVDVGVGNQATLAFDTVAIERTDQSDQTAALLVKSGSLRLILLDGSQNRLSSPPGHAGIENGGNELTILGSKNMIGAGSLTVSGGSGGAGIGGGVGEDGRNISILGGSVSATGGDGADGIGGGRGGIGEDISISGGLITAEAGTDGSDIGTGEGVTVTGGWFADTNASPYSGTSRGSIYGVQPAPGYVVLGSSSGGVYGFQVLCPTGDFLVTGEGFFGTDYDYGSNELIAKTDKALTVSMREPGSTTRADRIVVDAPGKTANLTLDGVNVDASASGEAAFLVRNGALSLSLANGSQSALQSGSGRAGLETGTNALMIRGAVGGTGALAATGADGGAGIGGGRGGDGSNISISGGRIKATAGGANASPIGGGEGGNGVVSVRITGGLFADGSGIEDNRVYGIEPLVGFRVAANEGADANDYPAAVVDMPTLSIAVKAVGCVYDGKPLDAGDLGVAARRGADDALDDVEYAYRAEGAVDWEDGLPTDVGTYEVRARLSEATVNGTRFLAAEATGAVTIVPKPLTAAVDGVSPTASKVYDGDASFEGVALVLQGVVGGDIVSAVADGTAVDSDGRRTALAGTWAFRVSGPVALSGADAANYTLRDAGVEGDASITKAPLVLRALDATMVAGGPLPDLAYEVEGLVTGDRMLVDPVLSVEGDTSVAGTLAISIEGGRVDNQDSYEISYVPGTLALTASPSGGRNLVPTGDASPTLALALTALGSLGVVLAIVRRRRRV